jgi:hypothetical protein
MQRVKNKETPSGTKGKKDKMLGLENERGRWVPAEETRETIFKTIQTVNYACLFILSILESADV